MYEDTSTKHRLPALGHSGPLHDLPSTLGPLQDRVWDWQLRERTCTPTLPHMAGHAFQTDQGPQIPCRISL